MRDAKKFVEDWDSRCDKRSIYYNMKFIDFIRHIQQDAQSQPSEDSAPLVPNSSDVDIDAIAKNISLDIKAMLEHGELGDDDWYRYVPNKIRSALIKAHDDGYNNGAKLFEQGRKQGLIDAAQKVGVK